MFEDPGNRHLAVGMLMAAGVITLSAGLRVFLGKNETYRKVATVSKIIVHPIKSCPGREVAFAEVTQHGLKSDGVLDRSWMLLDENKIYVTLRTVPKMALIDVNISDEFLVLNAPGKEELRLPFDTNKSNLVETKIKTLDVQGFDCGDEAAEWMSSFLEGNYRLVHFSENLQSKTLNKDPKFGHNMGEGETAVYQDYGPFNILSEASLADVNSRLTRSVDVRNFRPNIMVKDCDAFAEDRWRNLRIGDVELRFTHYCSRCKLTTVNHETGTIETEEPLTTLRTYRLCYDDDPDRKLHLTKPILGIQLVIEKTGTIRVGDDVYATT